MNKDIDYQIAPVLALHKPADRMQVAREAKVALARVASTTAAYVSFLAAQSSKRKTLGAAEVLRACAQVAVPGFRQAAAAFGQGLEQKAQPEPSDEPSQ